MAFYFAGNEVYTSAFAAVCVDLDKKPITIKASSKSYKASATKKYTVTLKDNKGNAIKNAKCVIARTGDAISFKTLKSQNVNAITLDDIGISALNTFKLEVTFENENVDIDNFLLKLTSAALSPVRADAIGKAEKPNDWAKSNATMVSSGPFRLNIFNYKEKAVATESTQTEKATDSTESSNEEVAGEKINIITEQYIVLERNTYYFRDFSKDIINKRFTLLNMCPDRFNVMIHLRS